MSDPQPATYRGHFTDPGKAAGYDRSQYAPGTYAALVNEVEQEQLAGIVDRLRATRPRVEYLDFASGTGRIIGFLEDRVDRATGIEISEAMCAQARKRLRAGSVICADITAPGAPVEGRYDLITAFRFVLNAEPALRRAAMKALAARLRDGTSVLVFNNHGNLFSHKLLLWPWHRLRTLGRGWQPEGNYMSNRQARALAAEAGLAIERTLGSAFLSPRIARLLPRGLTARLERRLARSGLLGRLGAHQMYVARKTGPPPGISGVSSA
jgi:SAM-dependent methyltransferase